MDFEYVFEPEWFNAGNGASRRDYKGYLISWSDASQHERFVNLVMHQIRNFAGTSYSEDALSCDCREGSTHIVMTNDLYCRVITQLQGIIMRCIREFQGTELGWTIPSLFDFDT